MAQGISCGLDQYCTKKVPTTLALLVASGFAALADPAHLEMVKSLPVTLEMACSKHGLGLEEPLQRLNAAAGR